MTAASCVPALGQLPKGARGIDANAHVSPAVAASFRDAGYSFIMRYVRRAQYNSFDVTAGEVLGILGAGMGVGIVQHVAKPGWMPSAKLGSEYGETAAREAEAAGIPHGATLWCDLEEVDSAADAAAVIGYVNAWTSRVLSIGFEPGLYVGYGCGLSADALYRKLRVTRYWSAYNLNRENFPAVRGVCMRQYPYPPESKRVPGVPFQYDENVVVGDLLGGAPTFLLPGQALARAA